MINYNDTENITKTKRKYKDNTKATLITTTYKECKGEGFYHTIKFLCFKRTFLACEICGSKHKDTGWKFSLL